MSAINSQLRPEFSVRIVVCDYYLSKPAPGIDVIYSDFRGSDIKQVPVLRVFGSTPDGRKACLHVHGVFPYFYVPCPVPNPQPQFLYQIAASLDKALNIALKQATSANQHVYKISLVKGLPFYGFHDNEHLYLKIFLYNPGLIKQVVELCSNGAILGQVFQPHESHLNFTLQFFIDFNLFGMSNIDLQNIKFRRSGISQNSDEPLQSPQDVYLKPESMCFYEADCVASHIINRQRVGKGDGIENPGLEEVWNQEKERRKQLNISMASKSLSQGRINDETESHYKFDQMFRNKISGLIDKPVVINTKTENNEVQYPAETMEGSQLFNAVDVSVHLPCNSLKLFDTLREDPDETLTEDTDNTIVDENLALNCSLSLHYSQVLLDSEDMELVNLLHDMDEQVVDEDSAMGTPANKEKDGDIDSDDAEYSQIFNEDTILLEPFISKCDADHDSSPIWNDSLWDGANIPQLDGTCDDDHVKKVRKRKIRLGLSKIKSKRKASINLETNSNLSLNEDNMHEVDEIDASIETIDSISKLHLKKKLKEEKKPSILNETNITDKYDSENNDCNEDSITDLVKKIDIKLELSPPNAAKAYDLHNNYKPIAGPSNINLVTPHLPKNDIELNESILSTQSTDENLGIVSFYNKSKFFDMSIEDTDRNLNFQDPSSDFKIGYESNYESLMKDKINLSENKSLIERYIPRSATFVKRESCEKTTVYSPIIRPPTRSCILSSLGKYNIPKNKNQQPYYSDHKDVGDKVEIGQILLKIQSNVARDQKPYEKVFDVTSIEEWRQLMLMQTNEMKEECYKPEALKTLLASNRHCVLEPIMKPPSKIEVIKWLKDKTKPCLKPDKTIKPAEICTKDDELDNSQVIGLNDEEIDSSISLEPSDKDKFNNTSVQITMQPDGSFLCFGNNDTPNINSPETPVIDVDFLTVMLLETLTSVRGDFHPDPLKDPIYAIFVKVTNDCPPGHFLKRDVTEIIVVDSDDSRYLDRCIFGINVTYVNTENEILDKIIEVVRKHDPDIMCGYEIEMNSWGYVIERAQALGLEIVREISRITEKHRQKRWRNDDNDFEGKVLGRIMFNVWRLFRHELALSSYSFENCMFEILKERVPKYNYAQLAKWWSDESKVLRWIPVEYYLTRLNGTVRMLEKLDIINRTSELARLFGLQWWEVLSRGSQFRVESLMLRAARPLNLVALSPTVKQRAAMRAPECLPLIFEPESRFYADPVIVLDFQSLYPSMMIAYNYCFSTCIGRVQNINGDTAYEFGAWRLKIPKSKLDKLISSNLVHWSPVGVGFVKPSVRRGVLPALLRRILAARQAVKKGMKLQTDETVKKAMHSRQLGLKLIANVTYGYTAANFSGRMPCVEVGDSVVAKGRETLERAIKLVRDGNWNAKVVYGDTDSMFVLVPGGTRAEAFQIGQEIADAVTADNPSPVALKLEKVYQPCILQTKKRYVGYMYESADQATPVYEAKGIETVRRDGCPAGVKLLQRSLCELFDYGDMSRVKRLVQEVLLLVCDGRMRAQELMFTREYHGPAGYRPGAAAPPNEIAKRIVSSDARAAPRSGERVSWLVCAGAPSTPLVRLARSPQELLKDPSLIPHVAYYVARVLLPPLHRCLSLLGADVFKWWAEVGYKRSSGEREVCGGGGGIARFLWRGRCARCGARGARALCAACAAQPAHLAALYVTLNNTTARIEAFNQICQSCCGHRETPQCENTECPVLWAGVTARRKLANTEDILTHLPLQYDKS